MNKHSAVLAADSAVTIREWDGERQRVRYFKGANKIFQISNAAPMGLMIYGGAELQGVPWEILVKDYRKELGTKRFDHSHEYASDFFSYVKGHAAFFSEERKKALSVDSVIRAVGALWTMAQKKHGEALTLSEIEGFADEALEKIDSSPHHSHFTAHKSTTLETEYLQASSAQILGLLQMSFNNDLLPSVADKLCKTAIKILLIAPQHYLSNTGVVIVGFGEKEYFPALIEYKCYGILFGELLTEQETPAAISIDNPAYIKPFAMSEMVDTFLNGLGRGLFGFIMPSIHAMLDDYVKNIITTFNQNGSAIDASITNQQEFKKLQQSCVEHFLQRVWGHLRIEHQQPLMRVLDSLSIGEMSELAETLIMLESLKERMTKDSESVGGPVDVAVINRNEGFVWIKRKHYFDPKLNVKYFQRNLFQVG